MTDLRFVLLSHLNSDHSAEGKLPMTSDAIAAVLDCFAAPKWKPPAIRLPAGIERASKIHSPSALIRRRCSVRRSRARSLPDVQHPVPVDVDAQAGPNGGLPALNPVTARKIMNKDQVKGAVKDAAGKVQEKAGEVVGSREQQAKGIAKQVEGTVQKKAGDVREAVEDVRSDRRP